MIGYQQCCAETLACCLAGHTKLPIIITNAEFRAKDTRYKNCMKYDVTFITFKKLNFRSVHPICKFHFSNYAHIIFENSEYGWNSVFWWMVARSEFDICLTSWKVSTNSFHFTPQMMVSTCTLDLNCMTRQWSQLSSLRLWRVRQMIQVGVKLWRQDELCCPIIVLIIVVVSSRWVSTQCRMYVVEASIL